MKREEPKTFPGNDRSQSDDGCTATGGIVQSMSTLSTTGDDQRDEVLVHIADVEEMLQANGEGHPDLEQLLDLLDYLRSHKDREK
jgi:hypothetical protein